MPKRRVTIFTSSGCETSLGIRFGSFSIGFVAVVGQDGWNTIRRQFVEEIVIDLNRGRPAAGPDALHLFQRENAVRRHAFVTDSQLILEAVSYTHLTLP